MKFKVGDLVEILEDNEFFENEINLLGIVIQEETPIRWGRVMIVDNVKGTQSRVQYFGRGDLKLIVRAEGAEYSNLEI